MFKIIYDFAAPATASLDEVLGWRNWSERERDLILRVHHGEIARFSTSHNGQYCDVTLNKEPAHAD